MIEKKAAQNDLDAFEERIHKGNGKLNLKDLKNLNSVKKDKYIKKLRVRHAKFNRKQIDVPDV